MEREALKQALEALGRVVCACEHFHHTRRHRHGLGEGCPVEAAHRAAIEAARAALEAQAEPAGWKLVPVEPTPEMLAVGDKILDCDDPLWVASGYRAMLAVSPQQPPQAALKAQAYRAMLAAAPQQPPQE